MWFFTKNILGYLCNEDISNNKRLTVLRLYKERVKEEIEKLSPNELIQYLFNSKSLKELKIMICDYINELSNKYGDEAKNKRTSLIEQFNKIGTYKPSYITSDTCPDILKKETISHLYKDKPYDVVKLSKESKKIKKEILRLCLSREQLIRLLNREISEDLKEHIIDVCLTSNYDLNSVLTNANVPDRFKQRVLDKRINKDNLYSFIDIVDNDLIEYVLKEKAKEFEECLKQLNENNILREINSYSTPRNLVDYIIQYKYDVVISAINKANRNDIEEIIKKEKNINLIKLIYERRPKFIYTVINRLYDFQLISFLELQYLPIEYKNYIITKRKRALESSINKVSILTIQDALKINSYVPEEIQHKIFEKRKKDILEYYNVETSRQLIRTINLSDLGPLIKRMIIEEKINKNNIFDLLGDYYIKQDTTKLVLELKNNIIKEKLKTIDINDLFKGKIDNLSKDTVETILKNNEDILLEKISTLTEEELYNYLSDNKITFIIKKVILEKLGIDKDNINNVLSLIKKYDIKLILTSYDNIKDLICGLGINFNSFLQYGSGSQKHSNWLDVLLEVIEKDDIGDFALCKDYLFNNYYEYDKENNVYIISNFLEYIDSYSKYKELFLNLIKDNVKLTKEDKSNLRFLFNVKGVNKEDIPKSINELNKFKLQLYKNKINLLKSNTLKLYELQEIFNDIVFCDGIKILANIGGTGALRTLKKDNKNSPTMTALIDELIMYSTLIEMVNFTNNAEGLRDVLIYIFSDINLLTKIQNMFSNLEEKVRKVYELDSINNLTTIEQARTLNTLDKELSHLYGGEVFNLSDKNYCLYGHVLSSRENIEDMLNGVSTGDSNFISVSPVSYRGQKYYFNINDVTLAYDTMPKGNFICSSIQNMGTNSKVSSNSGEVDDIDRFQRGILETSAVIERNAEALLYREGLKPCGLILPGNRKPTSTEMKYHQKYNLPFIITQEVHKSIDNPKYIFVNDLNIPEEATDISELQFIIDTLEPNITHVKENSVYTGREIGIIADCHSMYEPTLAVLEDMRRRGITEIYSLGDNIGLGPNPVEVFDLLEEYNVQSVSGNAEYYNVLGTEPFPYLTDDRLDSQLWTKRKLGPERINNLKTYPASRDLLVGNKKVALCHFANDVRWDFRERNVHSYRGNVEQLRYTNSDEAIRKITNSIVSNKSNHSIIKGFISSKEEPLFGGKLVTDYDYVLQGHYHFDLENKLDNTEILTLRAVGMGYVGTEQDNEACYYVIKERKDGEIDIDKRYVYFNKNALLSSIHTCDLPSKDKVLTYVKKSR